MNTACYHELLHANAVFAVKIIFDYIKPALFLQAWQGCEFVLRQTCNLASHD